MRILYIRLVNFVGVKAAMGLDEISFSFKDIDKPIVQLYGKNRCGKTVLIQQLNPFSSINLNGDERNDLSLIIPGTDGLKEIVYEVHNKVYHITHTYRATSKNHTVSSSIKCDNEELNPSGGVNTFNQVIETLFGINRFTFQLICNGTQLTSFGNMNASQRKTLLNKALGVDIYDKIHKLATDDYRYTNKIIASLANTQEYLLKTYGSYDSLCQQLKHQKELVESLSEQQQTIRSSMDRISGQLQTLRSQNPMQELMDIQRKCTSYMNAVSIFGGNIDNSLYDKLVNDQITLNQQLSDCKSEFQIIMHDIDDMYAKRREIESSINNKRKALDDLHNMEFIRDELISKINSIELVEEINTPSSYFRSMLTMAQAINSICSEIVTTLSDAHLRLFVDMIKNNIDISAFLIQEGSILMDSEKEKSVLSRLQSMIFSVHGEEPENCDNGECLYRRTYDTLRNYFKSYQNTDGKFTQYDIEQIDHAYKSLLSIKRMLIVDIPDEIKGLFEINVMMDNLVGRRHGVNVDRITFLMEESAKTEMRTQYIKQLNDVKNSIEHIRSIIPTDTNDDTGSISTKIQKMEQQQESIREKINNIQKMIDENDSKRLVLSDVRNIDISTLKKRQEQLETIINTINKSDQEYDSLSHQYHDITSQLQQCQQQLDILDKANAQYMKTMSEIEVHSQNDEVYRIIAEATSSTKGKPVITIRDTVNRALNLTNQLLHVMYEDEIQLLKPTINETEFTLPFRCGINHSPDIRYGSQSENTLLSLALSLSLASSVTPYNIYLVDEIDAYLDQAAKDGFVQMLQEIMVRLDSEQIFIISHSVCADQYPDYVQTVNISERIKELK